MRIARPHGESEGAGCTFGRNAIASSASTDWPRFVIAPVVVSMLTKNDAPASMFRKIPKSVPAWSKASAETDASGSPGNGVRLAINVETAVVELTLKSAAEPASSLAPPNKLPAASDASPLPSRYEPRPVFVPTNVAAPVVTSMVYRPRVPWKPDQPNRIPDGANARSAMGVLVLNGPISVPAPVVVSILTRLRGDAELFPVEP